MVRRGFALASLGTAAYSLWPRYRRNRRPSEVYYGGHVAGIDSFQDFVPTREASTVTAAHRVQDQLWRVPRVVDRKYTLIRVALLLAAAASVLSFLVGGLEVTQANGRF